MKKRKYKSPKAQEYHTYIDEDTGEVKKFKVGSYDTYMRWVDKQNKSLVRQGLSPIQPIDKRTFDDVYRTTKENLLYDTKVGNRSAVGNVYQYIVRGQSYEHNYMEVQRLKKEGLLLDGVSFSEAIRASKEEFYGYRDRNGDWHDSTIVDWTAIQELYDMKKAMGMSGKQAKEWIKQEYFNSP